MHIRTWNSCWLLFQPGTSIAFLIKTHKECKRIHALRGTLAKVQHFLVINGALCAILLCGVTGITLAADNNTLATDLPKLLQDAMHQPERIQFKQNVEARGILGSYRWSAIISRHGDHTEVQANGAPSLFSTDLLADFSDFGKAMANFSLEYNGMVKDEAGQFLLVRYTRKPGVNTGALSGRLWVNPTNYLIHRIEARYLWGTATVEQTFTTIHGYVVLTKQNATLSPLAMRLTLTYSDYIVNR